VPADTFSRTNSPAEVVACALIRLLEAQFPVESPHATLRLKTVHDCARELTLHPNYLSRQVKAAKGCTVSSLPAARLVQEA
jgi:AraC family transcriptional activator of pobA